MKTFYTLFIATLSLFLCNCKNGQTQNAKTNLAATEFDAKMKELSPTMVIDVRTPAEFAKGHLPNAKNFDWNGKSFDRQIAMLSKEKPVFVYCLSGARSTSAANKMISEGFKEVYQLEGGILKWRGANLPEETDSTKTSGLTMQQFVELFSTDKPVLVDFYADWCEPCQLMKPYLDEIAKDMSSKLTVIRINTDDNQSLSKELKIDALPVLQFYKNKQLTWTHVGYIEKADVIKQLQ